MSVKRFRHVRRILSASVTLLATSCHNRVPIITPAQPLAVQCPVGAVEERPRSPVGEADSSLTQARVRWAVADLVAALNSRDVADLTLRYDWTGSSKERDDFLARARGAVASTRVSRDLAGVWWSDAPGRKQQALCLTLDVQWNNGGGVQWTHKVALRATMIDDGRAAWLSRLSIVDLTP